MNNIGILGGGQLGRMIAIAAHQLGFVPYIFTDDKNSPAIEVTKNYVIANYLDQSALLHFAESVDIVTFEFENIPFKTLEILQKNCKVSPNIDILKIAQNRILEKNFLRSKNFQTAEFQEINNLDDLDGLIDPKFPIILKTAVQGYDGKGQVLLKQEEDLNNLENFQFPGITEKFIDFKKELSIVVARNSKGIAHFPIAENVHSEGILVTSKVPAEIDNNIREEIIEIATNLANEIDLVGILAIEFFMTHDNKIIINEIAPRPHNSCHWSMDCCDIDQFQTLILAITENEIKKPNLIYPCIMQNLLGDSINSWKENILKKNHKVYIYGKKEIKDKRKMGHMNILLSE